MLETTVSRLVSTAAIRLERDVRQALPLTADRLLRWKGPLATAEDNLQPGAYPIFFLPVWAAPESLGSDETFHADIAFSTLSGLCFVRLVDDAADADTPRAAGKLIQSAGFFHMRFHSIYHRYFNPDHVFWSYFRHLWDEQTDVTVADANFQDIDDEVFAAISSRKTIGALIPVVASALRFDRADMIDRWTEFVVRLGPIQQITNDLSGFDGDLHHGVSTLLTSEFRRRGRSGEQPAAWLNREGLDSITSRLEAFAEQLTAAGEALQSEPVHGWVVHRLQAVRTAIARAREIARCE